MSVSIQIDERTAELHVPGFLWLPDSRLLCAADLHFEKGSFFHQFGSFLPPYDSKETLRLLEQGLAQFKPARFIALGDSFHDSRGGERLQQEERDRLNAAIDRVPEWIWITGNHDPAINTEIRGGRQLTAHDGTLVFRHKATPQPEAEVSGHYHPKTEIRLQRHRIAGACFVQGAEKLILPAFGVFAGGLDIDSAEFRAVIPSANRQVFLVHQERVFAL